MVKRDTEFINLMNIVSKDLKRMKQKEQQRKQEQLNKYKNK